jgi:hypothetical protein
MPAPPRYTNVEVARELRALAQRASGAGQERLLNLADLYDREDDLVAGSRRLIAETRTLLAEINRLFPQGRPPVRCGPPMRTYVMSLFGAGDERSG